MTRGDVILNNGGGQNGRPCCFYAMLKYDEFAMLNICIFSLTASA